MLRQSATVRSANGRSTAAKWRSAPFPEGSLLRERPLEGGGRGVNFHLAPSPYRALGEGGRSRHGPSGRCATADPAARSQERCRGCRWAGTSVRIAGGPKCASAPRVVFALQCGRKPSAAHRLARCAEALGPLCGAHGESTPCHLPQRGADAAEHADNWRPPCESPEARTVNRLSRSFSHSGTAVSGGARPSAPDDCGSSGLLATGKGQAYRVNLYAVRPGRVSADPDLAFGHRRPDSFGGRFGWRPPARLPIVNGRSQRTPWGHASHVPGRGWRGAVPPLTHPEVPR